MVDLRCLLIDDSEQFLASATRLLTMQGVEIVGCAGNGETALQLVAALDPDVVLVDIELGSEDGIELTQRLAAATRVVLISAHDRDDVAQLVAGSAAIGFLPKWALGADAVATLLASARPGT